MTDLYYVNVKDPVESRKDLLLSSRNVLDSLRRFEKYLLINEKKHIHIAELKHVFDELSVLNKKLKQRLPKVPGKAVPKQEKEAVVKKEPAKSVKSKLDVLEEELAKVESRLSSLE